MPTLKFGSTSTSNNTNRLSSAATTSRLSFPAPQLSCTKTASDMKLITLALAAASLAAAQIPDQPKCCENYAYPVQAACPGGVVCVRSPRRVFHRSLANQRR